jgi:outer membrane protein assembly factor BamA
MGVDMNVINFRLFKESPFWTSLYVPFSYNVTKVRTDASEDNNDANFKTLGLGVGLNFEIRRFNNFGLNFGYELKGYSFIGDYEEFNLSEPGYMRTQAVKAEIFYYPGLDKSNSIFLRMRSIRDISSGRGDSFFQLQFGYRFTLGVGAIKAR